MLPTPFKHCACVVSVAAALLVPSPRAAAEAPDATPQSMVAETVTMLGILEQFSPRGTAWEGALDCDAIRALPLTLSAGNEYAVIVAASPGMIAAELVDARDTEIASAIAAPNEPLVLRARVPASGDYTVRLARPATLASGNDDAPPPTVCEGAFSAQVVYR